MAVGLIVDAVSGVLLVALGVLVARIRPRSPTTLALATVCASLGVGFALVNFALSTRVLLLPSLLAAAASGFLASAALVYLGHSFPRPLDRVERRLAIVPAAIGIAFAILVFTAQDLSGLRERFGITAAEDAAFRLTFAGIATFSAAATSLMFLLPLRFRHADDALTRRRHAYMAAGLGIFVESNAGEALLQPDAPPVLTVLLVAFLLGVPTALWLVNAATRPDARSARNVAFVLLGSALAGMVVVVLAGDWAASQDSGGNGALRTAMVVVLAYAVLRGALLDVDARLHWTIRRGTLAAVFLAVFFIVAQVAQNFLATQYGFILGGVVAGLLLFAIAPLQRTAERIADRAVPLPPAPTASTTRAYTLALRAALADGRLTRAEEQHLADLAQELGIGAGDALRLRNEVETELGHA